MVVPFLVLTVLLEQSDWSSFSTLSQFRCFCAVVSLEILVVFFDEDTIADVFVIVPFCCVPICLLNNELFIEHQILVPKKALRQIRSAKILTTIPMFCDLRRI